MEENDKRYVYLMQCSFYEPNSGSLMVRAKSEEHARELLPKMLPHVKDLVVHDVHKQDEIDITKTEVSSDSSGTPPSVSIN